MNFDYVTSAFFRVIHSDGVFGGVTPSGKINIGFWNQRNPFPQRTVQFVDEQGRLGEELKGERISRDAILREMECSVVMDVDVAKSFVNWLNVKIGEAENEGKSAEKRGKAK